MFWGKHGRNYNRRRRRSDCFLHNLVVFGNSGDRGKEIGVLGGWNPPNTHMYPLKRGIKKTRFLTPFRGLREPRPFKSLLDFDQHGVDQYPLADHQRQVNLESCASCVDFEFCEVSRVEGYVTIAGILRESAHDIRCRDNRTVISAYS